MAETPSTRSRVFSKTETFSPNTATVHTLPAFSGTKNGGFQIPVRSPGWRFLKTEIHRIRRDWRKRRFSNTIMSCLSSRLALPHIRFENATCVRIFFKYGGKKCPFSKILGYVWMVKYDSKSLRVEADSF